MQLKKKLLLLLSVLISTVSWAQYTGLVTGNLTDEQGLSLPGATIKLLPGNRYTFADEYGKFVFLDVPPGTYTLDVEYLGYENIKRNIDVTAGTTTVANIKIKETGVSSLKEVVVIGDRLRGQAKALNQQKNKVNISNIISSDQVGRFPDANIGDALKRVPGVTMQNDQGEARNIIVRGLAPELNSVTLNGDRIPSAEGDNRRVQMDLIPADMVQTIEVNKTLTSDMDADAIGGSVNLITRASPGAQRISATVSGGYNPIRQKPLYNAGLVYGNRFFNNKLGVVLSGSHNYNNYGSDNVEAIWKKDKNDNVYIGEMDIRKYDVKRIRTSVAGAFDYQINAKNRLTLNSMYNWRDDFENRYRLRYRSIKPVYDTNDKSLITSFTGDARRQTKGGTPGKNQERRLEAQKVLNLSLKGDHILGEKIDMDWAISYSRAEEDRPNERYIEYEQKKLSFLKDFDTEREPLLKLSNAEDLSKYTLKTISENHNNTYESEIGSKINFRIPFSYIPSQKGRLRFGGRMRIKNKERDNNFFEYKPTSNIYKTFTDMNLITWNGKGWSPNEKYVPGNFVSASQLGSLDLTNTSLFEQTSIPSEFLSLNYKAKENIIAGYLRHDQDLNDKLTMILGLRLERTAIDYTGNVGVYDEDEQLISQKTINTKNDYINLLPSLAFKYSISNDFILRLAYSTALARPNYYRLTPFVNTLAGDNEITAGNPDLKAAYAHNFDVMTEYYFKSIGLVSGGVFYKKINNFIYTYRNQQYTQSNFTADYPTLNNPIPADENWTYLQDRNGESVDVYGFEIAFQRQLDFLPGFFKNFGIYTNYTYTKSKAKGVYNAEGDLREGITLPGTAPHMVNASLSWENKKFSARLSLNYTAAYLDELGGDDFEDRYYDKQLFIDANAAYAFTKSLRFFAEANNLTNQPLRYYQGVSARTMQMEYYKPRYNFGLKLDINR